MTKGDGEPRHLGGVRRIRAVALPISGSLAVLVTGMAYFFWWGSVVGYPGVWMPPGDIWATIRTSDYVTWGYLGGIYSAGTGLVTFPGILLVLAPAAALSNALGLQVDFPFTVPHATAWLVIGPYVLLVGCLPLFALDALGARMGLSKGRRGLLMVGEVAVIWQVLVLWGHPEDTIAIGVACYAIMAAFDGRWVAAGWLFGIAFSFQPLVLLIYPVGLIALLRYRHLTLREWAGMLARSAAVPAALLAVPLIANWRASTQAILDQPNYPTVDHPTPWLSFAPHLLRAGTRAVSGSRTGGHLRSATYSAAHRLLRGSSLTQGATKPRAATPGAGAAGGSGVDAVAAGPPRAIAVITAQVMVWRLRRWGGDLGALTWLCSACLALRCFFEPVMVPFYVWPAISVALVSAARRGVGNLVLCLAAGLAATLWSYVQTSSWSYWLVLVLLLAGVLASAGVDRSALPRLWRERVLRSLSTSSRRPA